MGKQFGGVYISGKVANIQYSLDGAQGFVKVSNPVSKDRILHGPEYALLRKEIAEFKGAAMAANTLQTCFGDNWKHFGERFLRARIQNMTRNVVKSGSGLNGQRRFEVGPNLAKFSNVELNKEDKFKNVFRPYYTVSVNPDRNTATWTVQSFHTTGKLTIPGAATHFRVFMSIGVLTDFVHVGGNVVYESSQPSFLGLSTTEYALPMVCNGSINNGFQVVASLPGLPVLPSDTCLVVCLGIEYLKYVNLVEEFYQQNNAMIVHGAF